MIRALSMSEVSIILNVIEKHLHKGRLIKYVDFAYDNRMQSVFTIKFRHWGGEEVVFTAVNRMLDENPSPFDNLYEEIMAWLRSYKD